MAAERAVLPQHGHVPDDAQELAAQLFGLDGSLARSDRPVAVAVAERLALAVDQPELEPSAWTWRVVQPLTTDTPGVLLGCVLVHDGWLYAYSGSGGSDSYLARWSLTALGRLPAGALARPDQILFAADLPKTRSGKIMRRLLRDVAEGKALGDTTTLADPNVVASLKEQYESEES